MHKPLYTLITGASSGLGKYLSVKCATGKMNLVLIDLPDTGLALLSDFLKETYMVDVIFIEADLLQHGACQRIYNEVNSRHIIINILINNAGIGGTFLFDEKQPEMYSSLIHLNVTVPTLLCRLFMFHLRSSQRSHILNVSSLVAFFRFPRKQVYAATKTFLLAFSQSLSKELDKSGVRVSVLCPGGMDTTWQITLQNHTKGNWLSRRSAMHPSAVATIAIDQMLAGKKIIIPGFWNATFLLLDKIFPTILKDALINLQSRQLYSKENEPGQLKAA